MNDAFPTLAPVDGRQILSKLRNDPVYPHASIVDRGELSGYALTGFDAISALRNAKESMGRSAQFDGHAAAVLHQHSRDLPPYVTSDAGYWRWLAIHCGPDVLEHRFGGSGLAGLPQFGLKGRWANYFRRLWFRADMCFIQNDADPYDLARRGSVDFWESGVFRPRYGSARNMVLAFITYAYPDPSRPNLDRWQLDGKMDINEGIRLLYKALKNQHAKIAYEVVSMEQCEDLMDALANDLGLNN